MKNFLNTDRLFAMNSWKQKEINIFLLLDCADEEGDVSKAIYTKPNLGVELLYTGTADEDDADIGPHLVKVLRGGALIQWFLDEGANRGIILFSECDTALLANHLRQHLECLWPSGAKKMFRFYAPNVFYYVLPSLTPEEVRLFLGPACGAACTRPVCAEEGDSLFVESPLHLELYTPPKKKSPWVLSGATTAAFAIPSEYSLSIVLTNFFCDRQRSIAKLMGKENVIRAAQKVIEQNRMFGLRSQGDLLHYFALVAKIGIGYNDDPIFQNLATEVRTAATPEKSLHALSDAVDSFCISVCGENNELYHAALNRALNTPYDVWHQPNSETEIVARLASVYPERVAYAGEQAVLELTVLARAEAEKRGLPLRPGVSILAGLMFFLGADCANTPLHPWIGNILEEKYSAALKVRNLFDMGRRLAKIVLRGWIK